MEQKTIKVQVRRFISYNNRPVETVEIAEGTDIRTMAEIMGIGLGEICALSVNGQQALLDQVLQPGDVVHFIPPIGGG